MYELLAWFGAWVAGWPPAVWATLSGSTITLIGVFFSDWRNTIRLKKQHDFAAEESQRTRVAGVRKDVYMSSSGTLARMQEYLLALPGVGGPVPPSPTTDFAEMMGKVSLVGEMDTVLLAQDLAAAYAATHVELAMLARPSQEAKRAAELHQEYRKTAMEQAKRVELEIAKYLETGKAEEQIFNALERSRASFQKRAEEYWQQEVDALGLAARELNKYVLSALQLLEPLAEKGLDLLVAVRRELDQRTDDAELRSSMSKHRERARQLVQNALHAIEDEVMSESSGEVETDGKDIAAAT